MKLYKIQWPTAAVAVAGIAAVVLVAIFAPPDIAGELVAGLGVLFTATAAALPAIGLPGFRQPRHQHLVDSGAVHINHFEAIAAPIKRLGRLRHPPHVDHQHTAQSVVAVPFLARQIAQAEQLLEIDDVEHAIDEP